MPLIPKKKKSLTVSLRNVYETFAISIPTVIDAALGRTSREACDLRLKRWSEKLIANANISVEIRGREHMTAGTTYLVMSNHQSLYDVPILLHVMGSRMRMVAKAELFRVPIWGPALRSSGFIEIDRHDRERAIQSLATAKDELLRGVHVWIAPEGTRSKTDELLPFKKGPFALAEDSKLPVLPVTLVGTAAILPAKEARSVLGVAVQVVIHPPLDPRAYSGANGRQRLSDDVRRAIVSAR